MKVISGTLKGRNIEGYNIDGTRPTMDRVKESLFATIQNNIKDSVVLDLFAGSGQLGIEAISNGAKLCYFIDNNKEVIKVLNKNISNLDIKSNTKVILSDWKKSLNEFSNQNLKFDLIFIDPPYDYNVYEKILTKVSELNLLSENGLIILEHSNLKFKDTYNNLSLYKEKKYGSKSINIYKINWQFTQSCAIIYLDRRIRKNEKIKQKRVYISWIASSYRNSSYSSRYHNGYNTTNIK